jgi:hypothetical protein
MKTRVLIPIAAALLVAPTASNAAAAPAQAGDWTAWYGCWRPVDTTNGDALICVLPGDGPTAVRMATVENGEITDETVVRADGVARPLEEGGCAGTESAFFSADGRRIFTRAELACSGLGRISTGMLAMVSEAEWVDAQALTVNGQHAARTIRYRAADASELPTWLATVLPQGRDLAQETARLDASMPLDVDAVAEASRHVAAPALEALLAERGHGFGLDAKKLVQLRDLGVPTSTIDVMIALSYPAKFAVEPAQYDTDRGAVDLDREYAAARADDCYESYSRVRMYDCYDSRFGYGYGYGYGYRNRYGYGYDPYRWNYGSTPVVVIVRPDEGDGDPRTGGAVVKGRGYTRTGATRGTASPRGPERTSSGATTVRSGSSTTTTRSSPPSSSGGSTTPRRTAKPRGGGN